MTSRGMNTGPHYEAFPIASPQRDGRSLRTVLRIIGLRDTHNTHIHHDYHYYGHSSNSRDGGAYSNPSVDILLPTAFTTLAKARGIRRYPAVVSLSYSSHCAPSLQFDRALDCLLAGLTSHRERSRYSKTSKQLCCARRREAYM